MLSKERQLLIVYNYYKNQLFQLIKTMYVIAQNRKNNFFNYVIET